MNIWPILGALAGVGALFVGWFFKKRDRRDRFRDRMTRLEVQVSDHDERLDRLERD